MNQHLLAQHQNTDEHALFRLLKTVSRSFYLSIRILPAKARQPIAIAYLLARAADSIADSPFRGSLPKQKLLHKFAQQLNQNNEASISSLTDNALTLINEPDERRLLHNLVIIFDVFNALPAAENKLVKQVAITLISAMQQDMETFTEHFTEQQQINCMQTKQDLETYIYRAAGCVGEFWTKILLLHYSQHLSWNTTQQVHLAINFGKALQLTNILRDIRKDAELGRCYLPRESLERQGLNSTNYLSENNQQALQFVSNEYFNLCLNYYTDAENYLTSTPKSQLRMRMAAFWPIAIGLKTLVLLTQRDENLSALTPIKVRRNWVYQLLLISPFLLVSNRLTKHYLQRIKQDINSE